MGGCVRESVCVCLCVYVCFKALVRNNSDVHAQGRKIDLCNTDHYSQVKTPAYAPVQYIEMSCRFVKHTHLRIRKRFSLPLSSVFLPVILCSFAKGGPPSV